MSPARDVGRSSPIRASRRPRPECRSTPRVMTRRREGDVSAWLAGRPHRSMLRLRPGSLSAHTRMALNPPLRGARRSPRLLSVSTQLPFPVRGAFRWSGRMISAAMPEAPVNEGSNTCWAKHQASRPAGSRRKDGRTATRYRSPSAWTARRTASSGPCVAGPVGEHSGPRRLHDATTV